MIMVGITARLIAGTVLGVLFLCAFAIGMVCDLLNRESHESPAPAKKREHGTAARSAESLQRVFHLGRDQA
jgi:Na+-transporting methylmalonyl-CoA/oxaloacetate decarboxylase gamma subunit